VNGQQRANPARRRRFRPRPTSAQARQGALWAFCRASNRTPLVAFKTLHSALLSRLQEAGPVLAADADDVLAFDEIETGAMRPSAAPGTC
jgi:hypothetical protein